MLHVPIRPLPLLCLKSSRNMINFRSLITYSMIARELIWKGCKLFERNDRQAAIIAARSVIPKSGDGEKDKRTASIVANKILAKRERQAILKDLSSERTSQISAHTSLQAKTSPIGPIFESKPISSLENLYNPLTDDKMNLAPLSVIVSTPCHNSAAFTPSSYALFAKNDTPTITQPKPPIILPPWIQAKIATCDNPTDTTLPPPPIATTPNDSPSDENASNPQPNKKSKSNPKSQQDTEKAPRKKKDPTLTEKSPPKKRRISGPDGPDRPDKPTRKDKPEKANIPPEGPEGKKAPSSKVKKISPWDGNETRLGEVVDMYELMKIIEVKSNEYIGLAVIMKDGTNYDKIKRGPIRGSFYAECIGNISKLLVLLGTEYYECKIQDHEDWKQIEKLLNHPKPKIIYNSTCLLLPLACHFGHQLNLTNLYDIRTAMWMLDPDKDSDDFDELYHRIDENAPPIQLEPIEQLKSRLSRTCGMWENVTILMQSDGIYDLFIDLETPLTYVLCTMTSHGFPINIDELEKYKLDLENKIGMIAGEAMGLCGTEDGNTLNLNSHKELYDYLYIKLGLNPPDGYKKNTSEETLQRLVDLNPLPALIIKYRHFNKILGTYIVGLKNWVYMDGDYPKLHSRFLQQSTGTGRLSSVDPNVQNLPKQPLVIDEDKRININIRDSLCSPNGYKLVTMDYEQIELRMLAHITNDTYLLDALKGKGDVLRRIAANLYKKPVSEVSDKEREAAKRVTYGMIYGIGVNTLAQMTSLGHEGASRLMKEFRSNFPDSKRYCDSLIRECRKNRYVITEMKRIRRLPDINETNNQKKKYAERQAVNTVVQGSAADCIKNAMINIHRLLKGIPKEEVKLICQVHDELIFLMRDDCIDKYVPSLQKAMTESMKLKVDLSVKVKVGKCWGKLDNYQPPVECIITE
uniref:DNA-directed DNA polymerase n=1 Tax=Peranema sp. FAL010 TaxID=2696997 RepID=A0A6F8QH74_9EUGL|nr:putative mitochondrial DNA polymerase [Peranema sp. FAL010]